MPAANNENASTTVLPVVVRGVSEDEAYGYTAENPVRVDGGRKAGARNQLRYLKALKGPQCKVVAYERQASCCPFKTRRGVADNIGMFDLYAVTWEGKITPVKLYINMYRNGRLMAPQGFTGTR